MDLVTHAASGALLSLALPWPLRARHVLFCALIACLPDADILFCTSPELFLTLHRGLSHSLVFLPLLALVISLPAFALRRRLPGALSPVRVLVLVLLCFAMHLALDCLTSYGTMLFQPFSAYRVRLNALFIADVFLAIPLLACLIWAALSRARRRHAACLGLAWLALWPCLCLACHAAVASVQAERFAAEERRVTSAVLLPDFFSPLYWRSISLELREDGTSATLDQSLSGLGRPRGHAEEYDSLTSETALHMAAQSSACRDFLRLMLLPVMEALSEEEEAAARSALAALPPIQPEEEEDPPGKAAAESGSDGQLRFLLIHDLRFGSGLSLGRSLLALRPNAEIPFRLMVVLDNEDGVLLERLIFSDSRLDTGWRRPALPEPQTFGRWLLGLS